MTECFGEFFRRDCQGHGIYVEIERCREAYVYTEFFEREPTRTPSFFRSWRWRLKKAREALCGHVIKDDEILTLGEARRLGEHLLTLVQEEGEGE